MAGPSPGLGKVGSVYHLYARCLALGIKVRRKRTLQEHLARFRYRT